MNWLVHCIPLTWVLIVHTLKSSWQSAGHGLWDWLEFYPIKRTDMSTSPSMGFALSSLLLVLSALPLWVSLKYDGDVTPNRLCAFFIPVLGHYSLWDWQLFFLFTEAIHTHRTEWAQEKNGGITDCEEGQFNVILS